MGVVEQTEMNAQKSRPSDACKYNRNENHRAHYSMFNIKFINILRCAISLMASLIAPMTNTLLCPILADGSDYIPVKKR